jgi:hypothetical protein
MAQIGAVFNELERALIAERTLRRLYPNSAPKVRHGITPHLDRTPSTGIYRRTLASRRLWPGFPSLEIRGWAISRLH